MTDKENAARAAWWLIKLSELGRRPVRQDPVATRVGVPAREARGPAGVASRWTSPPRSPTWDHRG